MLARRNSQFLTFGGGYSRYRAASHRLGKEAQQSGVFGRVEALTDKDLARQHRDFTSSHSSMLRRDVRGFGYWIWKPHLIGHALRSSSVSYLMFLDAGCVLNLQGASARVRLDEYHDLADVNGIMVMQLDQVERVWCKVDTMDRIGLDEGGRSSGQIEGGVLLIRNSSTTQDLIAEWLELCCEARYRFVDDSPSLGGEAPGFREHRHDQAVFSCLCKLAGIAPIPDETYFASDWPNAGKNVPVWAPRHKWGSSFRPGRPPSMHRRLERYLVSSRAIVAPTRQAAVTRASRSMAPSC